MGKKKNKVLFLYIGIFLILIVAGYFFLLNTSEREVKASREYNVAYFGASTITPYWVKLNSAFEKTAQKRGINLVDFSESIIEGEMYPENISYIRNLMENNNFDAVIWGDGGDAELSQAVAEYLKSIEIPLFVFEIDIENSSTNGLVTIDNYESAKLLGKYIYEETSGVGNVLIIIPNDFQDVAIDRRDGVVNILEERNMNIEVVNEDDPDWTVQNVYETVEEKFANNEYSAIFTAWDEATLVARNHAEEIGKNNDAVYVGFDGLQKMLEAIDEGYTHATIMQPTEKIAKETIGMTIRHLENVEYEKEISIPGVLITRDNVNEYLE